MNLPASLYQIFRTPTQVRIIEELLKRPNDYFTVSKMAKIINASPSAVSLRVERLGKLGIVRFVGSSEKAKIFKLNTDSPIVKALLEFAEKLEKVGGTSKEKLVTHT